jgi:hypothetical protein
VTTIQGILLSNKGFTLATHLRHAVRLVKKQASASEQGVGRRSNSTHHQRQLLYCCGPSQRQVPNYCVPYVSRLAIGCVYESHQVPAVKSVVVLPSHDILQHAFLCTLLSTHSLCLVVHNIVLNPTSKRFRKMRTKSPVRLCYTCSVHPDALLNPLDELYGGRLCWER